MANEKEKKVQDNGEWFDEKYKSVLDILKNMPKDMLEQRKERYEWMKMQPEYDQFIIDLMNTWKTDYYEELKKRLQNNEGQRLVNSKYTNDKDSIEEGIASLKYRKIKDPLILVEVIKQAIENYTGVNKAGNTFTFLQNVGLLYKQRAWKEGADNDFRKNFTLDINKNRVCILLRLYRKIEELSIENNTVEKNLENLKKIVLEDKQSRYTKKEIELAEYIIRQGVDFEIESLESSISGDNEYGEKETHKDRVKDDKDYYIEVEEQDQDALEILFDENS